MKHLHSLTICTLSLSAFATLSSCSKSSSSTVSSISADKPSTAITVVSAAVKTAGTSMGAAGVSAASLGHEPVFHPMDISQDCSIHAEPLRAGATLTQSDPDYPGKFMYCKLAYNTEDEESVQGAFVQVKSISCMLENAGLTFDGQSHSFTVTIDSTCWSANQLTKMGGAGASMTIIATGSAPAAFNTHYERGISMVVPDVGTIQLATNVTTSKVEFMETESLSANNKYGAFAASLDYSTGELRYESREDRYNDTVDSNSGGFGRHQRVYAKVVVSGQEVTGLSSVSAAQVETYNGAVQSGYGGQAITATGNLTTGIKARFWAGPTTNTTALSNASLWTETTNTRCYTDAGATGTGCSAGTPIPTTNAANSFPFALVGTGFTGSVAWGDALSAWTFTTSDPALESQ